MAALDTAFQSSEEGTRTDQGPHTITKSCIRCSWNELALDNDLLQMPAHLACMAACDLSWGLGATCTSVSKERSSGGATAVSPWLLMSMAATRYLQKNKLVL